jgi:hypothetical protein
LRISGLLIYADGGGDNSKNEQRKPHVRLPDLLLSENPIAYDLFPAFFQLGMARIAVNIAKLPELSRQQDKPYIALIDQAGC